MDIKIRNSGPGDQELIFSTWLKSYRYSSDFAKNIPDDVYFDMHHKAIEAVLKRCQALIACNPCDPDQIYGWCVREQQKFLGPEASTFHVVHYLYVKTVFRRFGISKLLLPGSAEPVVVTHLTFLGKKLLPEGWKYCPYFFHL